MGHWCYFTPINGVISPYNRFLGPFCINQPTPHQHYPNFFVGETLPGIFHMKLLSILPPPGFDPGNVTSPTRSCCWTSQWSLQIHVLRPRIGIQVPTVPKKFRVQVGLNLFQVGIGSLTHPKTNGWRATKWWALEKVTPFKNGNFWIFLVSMLHVS